MPLMQATTRKIAVVAPAQKQLLKQLAFQAMMRLLMQ